MLLEIAMYPDSKLYCAGPDIVITAPGDARVRYIADALASYVVHDGCAFEQVCSCKTGKFCLSLLLSGACPVEALCTALSLARAIQHC